MLARLVEAGEIPVLADRLPEIPKVITPRNEPGVYCDAWRMSIVGIGNLGGITERNFAASLVHWAMDWESLEPGIAEKWDVSPDGRHFTFYLRKGLKFSNGQLFTADDVEFSYQHVIKNRTITTTLPGWVLQNGTPAKFTKLGRYKFKFSFPESNGAFLLYMATESGQLMLPKHYFETKIPPFVSEEKADSIAVENGFSKWYQYFNTILRHPHLNPELPTVKPWVRITPRGKAEIQWEFVRNPYYYAVDNFGRQLPYFDRVILTNLSEPEQVYLKVASGEIDCQDRHIEGDRAPFLLEKQQQGNYRVSFFPMEPLVSIFINQTQEDDSIQCELNRQENFRLALSLAINRPEVEKLLNWGQGRDVREMVIPPEYRNDPDLLKWFEFDLERANSLLDGLKLKRGPEGWRLRSDNQDLVMTVYIVDYYPIDFLELVQEYWREIGVKLIIKKISYRSWWNFANAFRFSLISFNFVPPFDRTLILFPYHLVPYYSATYWGGKWGLWYTSEGKAGEEPPENVKHLISLWEAVKREINEEKQLKIIHTLCYESLKMGHTLLIKSQLPGINIVKNNFYNVSEGFPRQNWQKRSPSPDYPETYFMRD